MLPHKIFSALLTLHPQPALSRECYISFMRLVRLAQPDDADAIWRILEPIVRAGETYTLPREMTKDQSLAYWMGADHEVFVAEEDGQILGTYFLQPNHKGGGCP